MRSSLADSRPAFITAKGYLGIGEYTSPPQPETPDLQAAYPRSGCSMAP
jgi:hypothetical protein